MDDRLQKAFDFAQDTTKQLITLATGVVTVTLTFLTDVVKTAPSSTVNWLHAAWCVFLVSIVFGIFTLQNLTGNLERPAKDNEGNAKSPSIYGWSIRVFSIGQILSFGVAIALTLVFGVKAV